MPRKKITFNEVAGSKYHVTRQLRKKQKSKGSNTETGRKMLSASIVSLQNAPLCRSTERVES